jgi:hypothetical protein
VLGEGWQLRRAANEVDTLAISGALVFNFGFGF